MKHTANPFGRGFVFKKSRHHSETRDIVALAGAALIFFVGLPGHSSVLIQSAQHIAKNLITLILVFLGLSSPAPMPQNSVAPDRPALYKAMPTRPKVNPGIANSMQLNTLQELKRYMYRFEGKATHEGAACANASVLVRILSGDKTFAKGSITNEDGTYSIEVAVLAADSAPVDWQMEAFTSEFKKLELSGRRIVREEEEISSDPIVVTTPVEFTISRSH